MGASSSSVEAKPHFRLTFPEVSLFILLYHKKAGTTTPFRLFNTKLIVFRFDLEIRLRVITYRANLRRVFSNMDVSAIRALPNRIAVSGEYELTVQIAEQLQISLLMLLFNLPDFFK